MRTGEVTHVLPSPSAQTITTMAFRPGTSKLLLTNSGQGVALTATLPDEGLPPYSHHT